MQHIFASTEDKTVESTRETGKNNDTQSKSLLKHFLFLR